MIEQFFRPDSEEQALELKSQYQEKAVWFAGGSKINSTPNGINKPIAISLENLDLEWADWDNKTLRIGAMTRLEVLREMDSIPPALKDALGFVYSRHLRNQATIGGEIAAHQEESVLLPVLLALDTVLLFADGITLSLEEYLAAPSERLLTEIIIIDPFRACTTRRVCNSQSGLTVLTAAVAVTETGEWRIALDGVAEKAFRLRDVEARKPEEQALEKAVGAAIFPRADIRGSVEYKRYIAGVVVADLYADCQNQGETIQ